MKFSIITATIERPSLQRCMDSVESQLFRDCEHIISVDSPRTNNYGNTPRHKGWELAHGDWVLYLDDDNYLADQLVLKRISESLERRTEPWAIFPIMRHGRRFFYDPPGSCYVDTANMVIRREIAQWPDRPEYTLDGIFCDELKAKYPYASFPDVAPIVIMEQSGRGL